MKKSLDEIYDYALSYFGDLYQWGGEGPPRYWGFDCSGYVQRILRYAQADPPGDQTAQGLHDHLALNGISCGANRGAVAFFSHNNRVVHCGWMIDDKCMISASGGGSHVNKPGIAKNLNAHVKIQPIAYYNAPKLTAIYMPRYPGIGL